MPISDIYDNPFEILLQNGKKYSSPLLFISYTTAMTNL